MPYSPAFGFVGTLTSSDISKMNALRKQFGGATRTSLKKNKVVAVSQETKEMGDVITLLFGAQKGYGGFELRNIQSSTGTESGANKLVSVVDQDGVTWKFNVWSMT